MKIKLLPTLFFFASFFNFSFGQNLDYLKNYGVLFHVSSGYTSHYNSIVDLTGAPAEIIVSQDLGASGSFHLGFYATYNETQKITVTIGITKLNFLETGYITTGISGQSYPYTHLHNINFMNFQIGHFYEPKFEIANIGWFVENIIVNDWKINFGNITSPDFVKRNAYSYKIRLGIKYNYNPRFQPIFNIFYKTAITKYNQITYDKKYYPYAIGIELGGVVNF